MLAICRKPMASSRRRLSADEMARRGVRLLNKYGMFLECNWCYHTWSPRLRRDLTLPRRFWECPNRCNW